MPKEGKMKHKLVGEAQHIDTPAQGRPHKRKQHSITSIALFPFILLSEPLVKAKVLPLRRLIRRIGKSEM